MRRCICVPISVPGRQRLKGYFCPLLSLHAGVSLVKFYSGQTIPQWTIQRLSMRKRIQQTSNLQEQLNDDDAAADVDIKPPVLQLADPDCCTHTDPSCFNIGRRKRQRSQNIAQMMMTTIITIITIIAIFTLTPLLRNKIMNSDEIKAPMADPHPLPCLASCEV